MKIDIIICYIPRYNRGHMVDFVPPITGIHLASITPEEYDVRVIHQQVDNINFDSDADLIALSFFSGFAPMAYRLAKIFHSKGKTVIAGGPHVTFNKTESLEYFDSILVGEAESTWRTLLSDFKSKRLKRIYNGISTDLKTLPTPRYDLLPNKYFIKKVVQATRGCYYKCSFCTVPILNPGYRMRSVEAIVKDACYARFKYWWQKKVVWFWDDNLLINRRFAFQLLEALIPLNKWWLTQASIDIADDEDLLLLMKKSGCIGIFIGIESFSSEALQDANKKHNKLKYYKSSINKLHQHGIAVMAGLITGFDSDTPQSISEMSQQILDLGIDVPFISILTPFTGTSLNDQFLKQNRLLAKRGWKYYNGYNVAFRPAQMSPSTLLQAHRNLWQKSFSFTHTLLRIFRSILYLNPGAFFMSTFMNTFYGMKSITGNLPKDMTFFSLNNALNSKQSNNANLKNFTYGYANK